MLGVEEHPLPGVYLWQRVQGLAQRFPGEGGKRRRLLPFCPPSNTSFPPQRSAAICHLHQQRQTTQHPSCNSLPQQLKVPFFLSFSPPPASFHPFPPVYCPLLTRANKPVCMGHIANENDARMYNEKWSCKEPNQPRVTLVMSIISATGLYCSPINSNTITAEESKPQLGRGNKTKCSRRGNSEWTQAPLGTRATSRALTSDLSCMQSS